MEASKIGVKQVADQLCSVVGMLPLPAARQKHLQRSAGCWCRGDSELNQACPRVEQQGLILPLCNGEGLKPVCTQPNCK